MKHHSLNICQDSNDQKELCGHMSKIIGMRSGIIRFGSDTVVPVDKMVELSTMSNLLIKYGFVQSVRPGTGNIHVTS